MQKINVKVTPYFVRKARKLGPRLELRSIWCPVSLATQYALRRLGVITVWPSVCPSYINLRSGDSSTSLTLALPRDVIRFIMDFDLGVPHHSYPEFTLRVPSKVFNSWQRKAAQAK